MEGLTALVLVQVCFGLFPLLVHLATDPTGGFQPRALAVWRMVVGATVLSALALARHRARFLLARADLGRFALCSFLGVVANQVLALEGVARTSVTQAGLLMTLIPVFTYVLAVLVRQEHFRPLRAAGIGVALLGAVLLVLQRADGGAAGSDPRLGNLLIVANCLSYAGYLVLAGRLLTRYPTMVVIAWMFVFSLGATPLLAWGQELAPVDVTERARNGLVGLILLPTIVAYLLNTFALARVSASTTAAFIYLQPFIAGLSGAWFLGERLSGLIVVAAALLFAGIGLVIRGGDGSG